MIIKYGILLASVLFVTSALAQDVMTLLKPYYPIYNHANQCQGVWANNGSYDGQTNEPYQSGYCIKLNSQYTVNTKQGKRLYAIVTGDVAFDEYGKISGGSHVQSGLVGMFVFKPKGSGWQIESASPYINAGSSGRTIDEWQFVKLGVDTWGFIGEHADVHYGVFESSKVILTPDGLGGVMDSWIAASYHDDSFACLEAQEQGKICDDIDSVMVVETDRVVNGFYPLSFIVTGHLLGVEYQYQDYRIIYKPNKGYVAPKNYPFLEIDEELAE